MKTWVTNSLAVQILFIYSISLNFASNKYLKQPNNQTLTNNQPLVKIGNSSEIYYVTNEWMDSSLDRLDLLKAQNIRCDRDNSALNGFKLELSEKDQNNNRKMRYSYSCVTSTSITNNCNVTSTQTINFDNAKLNLNNLDRLSMECEEGQVLRDYSFDFSKKS